MTKNKLVVVVGSDRLYIKKVDEFGAEGIGQELAERYGRSADDWSVIETDDNVLIEVL